MSNTAIVTDSNSGITPDEARSLGIHLVPMPFFIDGELFYEGINLSHRDFFRRMSSGADITTSQPTPGDVLSLWDELLESHDDLVYIPMSSALSGSCATANALADDYDAGLDAASIAEILTREKLEASIYITVDTLKYLKKGGRITPAAASLGTVLGIKPVLQIQGEKLDALSMAHGLKSANAICWMLWNAI